MAQPDTKRLYNKYRPNILDQMVGQDEATAIIRGILKNKGFHSSREFILESEVGGVGKSTIGRILAQGINCENISDTGEPCKECEPCKQFDANIYQDYIEVNGAEYNTVDKMKSVINLASQYPNNSDGWRVIIIDEFQRVSKQAQSEFLDLLEFKSNKTIFVFTTTEMHQILQPIQTRCMNIPLKKIKPSVIKQKLVEICEEEGISYDDESLVKISLNSDSSLREAIKLVDLYRISFGAVKNLTMTDKYSKLLELIFFGITHQTEMLEEGLYDINTSNLYKDLGIVLFELRSNNLRRISPEYWNKYKILMEPEIDNLVKNYLLYKPQDQESFVLWCSLIDINVTSTRKNKEVERTTREYSIKEKFNASLLFIKYGFKRNR